jgi:hypothetical protein
MNLKIIRYCRDEHETENQIEKIGIQKIVGIYFKCSHYDFMDDPCESARLTTLEREHYSTEKR